MNRRGFVFAASMLLTTGLIAQSAPATPPNQPTQKILIHVGTSDPANWQAALKKADALMAASAKPYDTYVEILATGDGLKLIDKNSPMGADLSNSISKDVSFVACHASMKATKMADNQVATGVGIVPSGGREMAARKDQGWTILEDKAIK